MLDKVLVIGFGHKARQGKDTAVQAIIDAKSGEWNVKRYAFADSLKEEVAGKELELCLKYGIPWEPEGKNRKLLQWYGEYRRKQDPYYWVKKLMTKLKEDQPQIALISDVRYRNEAYFVKGFFGRMVKVVRSDFVDLAVDSTHRSETDLDNYEEWDATITVLNGEVDQLKKDAVRLFDYFIEELDHTKALENLDDMPMYKNNAI